MNCRYCGFLNSEDEHRCTRCGRRLRDNFPPFQRGAAVPVPKPVTKGQTFQQVARFPRALLPVQQALFGPPQALTAKVISFDSIRPGSLQAPYPKTQTPRYGAECKSRARVPRKEHTGPHQSALDFLPPVDPPRRLKTSSVEATINCDAPVAPRSMRFMAVVLDSIIVGTAFAVLPIFLYLRTGSVPGDRMALLIYAAAFGLMFLFYKVLGCFGSRETLGPQWMGLQILHFDGRPPGRRQRLLRLAACCLSIPPAAAGLLWALADEERLTWHDHMSKTFTTLR